MSFFPILLFRKKKIGLSFFLLLIRVNDRKAGLDKDGVLVGHAGRVAIVAHTLLLGPRESIGALKRCLEISHIVQRDVLELVGQRNGISNRVWFQVVARIAALVRFANVHANLVSVLHQKASEVRLERDETHSLQISILLDPGSVEQRLGVNLVDREQLVSRHVGTGPDHLSGRKARVGQNDVSVHLAVGASLARNHVGVVDSDRNGRVGLHLVNGHVQNDRLGLVHSEWEQDEQIETFFVFD